METNRGVLIVYPKHFLFGDISKTRDIETPTLAHELRKRSRSVHDHGNSQSEKA